MPRAYRGRMALFADRAAAGRMLAGALASERGEGAVVFGIPRGGMVVAAEVARALGLPLDAVVVRKLGAPSHMEFAVGAIADDVRIVDDGLMRAGRVTAGQLADVEERERAELRRREALFRRGAAGARALATAIVVDDGVVTGSTANAACASLRAGGAARIVLAVPVAPAEWTPPPNAVDAYVCPHRERGFWAVGQYYDDFTQTDDAEVVELLSHDLRE